MATTYAHNLKPKKLALIDQALERYNIKSIADLGACWGVHGGYAFHALDHAKMKKAYIVDQLITEPTKERAANYPQVKLITGALGDKHIAKEIGKVDAIIMYDIILHQVAPNWDEFLEMWGKNTKHLIIYNQDWAMGDDVVRFPDKDADWFIQNVPHTTPEGVRAWYAKHNEMSKDHIDRKLRDVHYFWQWGIPLKRLTEKLESIGFKIDLAQTDTPWSAQYPHIHNDMILASKP